MTRPRPASGSLGSACGLCGLDRVPAAPWRARLRRRDTRAVRRFRGRDAGARCGRSDRRGRRLGARRETGLPRLHVRNDDALADPDHGVRRDIVGFGQHHDRLCHRAARCCASVSPGATTCTPDVGASAVFGAPTGPIGGITSAVEAGRCGACNRHRSEPRDHQMFARMDRRIADVVRLHDRGDRHVVLPRHGLKRFAGPTTTGVPPSQVQVGGGGAAGIEPVTSELG
jgi:hypothetical protein